jgi:uncharacterized protein YggE
MMAEENTMIRSALFLLLLPCSAIAQNSPGTVQAIGNATISVAPDQAQLSISVTTEGPTADAAGQQNANTSFTLMTALNALIGGNGSIQTLYYSVSPRYSASTSTQPSTIVGYTATNSLQVTLNNLTLIGKTIDTANQSGATSVGGLSLGLQNPEPTMLLALSAASKQAQTHAAAIASGLGGKVGSVISASQSTSYTPIVSAGIAAGAAATNIQAGPVSVSASVTVTFQLQ